MTSTEFLAHMEATFRGCLETARRKNQDYAGDADPFKNFKVVEGMGISSVEHGMLVRLCDKFSRISNLLDKEAQVKDESIQDTIDDAINYFAILKAWLHCKKTESTSSTEVIDLVALADAFRKNEVVTKHE